MTQILVKHIVKDYEDWKKAFDGFVDFRRSSGEKVFRIMAPDNNPNDLTLLFDWDTKANAEKFFHSEELKKTMQNAGVAEEPKITFLHEVAEGKL